MDSPHWYIIHPFSNFRYNWDNLMLLVYTAAFFIIPADCINIFVASLNPNNFINYSPYIFIVHSIFILDILFNFLTGYSHKRTRKIITHPGKIVKKYLMGYFFFDILSSVPAIVNSCFIYHINGRPLVETMLILNLLKIVRIKTYMDYIPVYSHRHNTNYVLYKLLRMTVISVMFFYWGACLVFVLPFFFENITAYSFNSWIHFVQLELQDDSLLEYFTICLVKVITLSLACSVKGRAETASDLVMAASFAILGILYRSYMFIEFLDMIRSLFEPETKYDEFVTQLEDYMRHDQMPANIQKRLKLFYKDRFQGTYFKESAIMSSLSDELRKEIICYECKRMMSKVKILNSISSVRLMEMIKYFVQQVYLPGDLICKAGTIEKHIYFLSRGTVAVYSISGKEICHLYDGDYFGEIALLTADRKITVNLVAIEICNVYIMEHAIFSYFFANEPEATEKLLECARKRIRETKAIDAQHRKTLDLKSSVG
ncbi:I[[h]] channel [Carabus blaptoides fortunei]